MPHTRRQNNRRQRKRRLWLLTELFFGALLAVLLFSIGEQLLADARISREESRSARRMQSPEPFSAPAAAPCMESPPVQDSLQPLLSENQDAVGLLAFGEDHALYVCQGDDNLYYLDHQFDKTQNDAGAIFMDFRNSLWPRSDNLILYGHNMRNGSRFGTLGRYENPEYLLQHPTFQLADLYETVDYLPFALFHTSVLPDNPAYFAFDQIDFADESAFDAYIREVKSRSTLELPVEASYGDRLLTLVTCSSTHERGRLVIVCREVKPDAPD